MKPETLEVIMRIDFSATDGEQIVAHAEKVQELVRCGECRHYQGNHKVPGCAPCKFWGIGEVMWDDFCKRGKRWDEREPLEMV